MNSHEHTKTSSYAAQELADTISLPIKQARAMPRSVYTSTDFLERELDAVFRHDWFCAGRVSTLNKPGDYLTLELADQSILVIRDRQGVLRAQSNVCLHRMSALLERRGNKYSIVCPYHAWTYETNDQLRGAPATDRNTRTSVASGTTKLRFCPLS